MVDFLLCTFQFNAERVCHRHSTKQIPGTQIKYRIIQTSKWAVVSLAGYLQNKKAAKERWFLEVSLDSLLGSCMFQDK